MTEPERDMQPDASRPAESTTGTRAFQGGLWQLAAAFAPYVYTMVASIVAAHVLGPDRMGRMSFIAFTVVVAQALATGGLGSTIVRYVGELIGQGRERMLPSLAAWGWKVTGTLGALAALVLVGVAVAGASPTLAWLFAAVAALAGVMNKASGGVVLGSQGWRSHALVGIVTGAVAVVATVVVLVLGGGVSGVLGVTAATAVTMLVWLTVLALRRIRPLAAEREPLGALSGEMVRFSLALSLPVIFGLIVAQRSELFFLEHYSSDRQIALYSIAFSATAALTGVSAAIAAVLTPSVATLAGSGEFDRIRGGFSRVLRLGLLFSFPLTGAALALGPSLLHLVYGPRYVGVGSVLLVILLTLPLIPVSSASNALLIGYGRLRAPIVVGAIAAAVDLGLAAFLVPRLDAIGAAIANTCASFVAAALLFGATVRLVGHVDLCGHFMLRVVVISAVSAVLARLVLVMGGGPGVFLLATAVEIVALGVGATTLRPVSADDASFLLGVAGGRARVARILGRLSDTTVRVPG